MKRFLVLRGNCARNSLLYKLRYNYSKLVGLKQNTITKAVLSFLQDCELSLCYDKEYIVRMGRAHKHYDIINWNLY